MFGLEVTFFKHLEMTEKQNKLYLKCLYLQEYKKGFASLTRFHYFNHRGGLSGALKMQLKIFGQTIELTLIFFEKMFIV